MKPDQNKLELEPSPPAPALCVAVRLPTPRYLLLPDLRHSTAPSSLSLPPFEGITSGMQPHKQEVFADPGNEGSSEWRVPAI